MNEAILTARSFLFVPGDRPERFIKAAESGADAVILDLEDAVPVSRKDIARRAIATEWNSLSTASRTPILIRTHAVSSAAWFEDVALLRVLTNLSGIVLPKTESAEDLNIVRSVFSNLMTIPLIESAQGWAALSQIARSPSVGRLAIGNLDFVSDTGLSPGLDENELGPLRFAVAMHTRLAGLASAIDGVTVQTDDAAAINRDTQRARRYGFGGKLCIHPRQVSSIHAAFAATRDEQLWAERVIAATTNSSGGAVLVDGKMVDRPVFLKAKSILATFDQNTGS